MKPLTFSLSIQAAAHRVWQTLWEDASFRNWSSLIDEGTYMQGDLRQGQEVQFLSSVNGYGVTALVEALVPDAFVQFRYQADTQGGGQQTRENQWTGGTEQYILQEQKSGILLTLKMDVPPDLIQTMQSRVPKALDRIKALAERS
ncbi:MAG: SRPBCC domain-containing protein [Firmicutes bacterium]|nr:SRPBCC domain-containing protein [Bacillota bacterium]